MGIFRIFSVNWWILHIAAIVFFLWLGFSTHF
jgi:hypothetical protein